VSIAWVDVQYLEKVQYIRYDRINIPNSPRLWYQSTPGAELSDERLAAEGVSDLEFLRSGELFPSLHRVSSSARIAAHTEPGTRDCHSLASTV
jgi:hypothetical protein